MGPEAILIASTSTTMIEMGRFFVQRTYPCIAAMNEEEVLRKLNHHPVLLLIVEFDGDEFRDESLWRISRACAEKYVPLLLIVDKGTVQVETVVNAIVAKLEKPFTSDEMLSILRVLLPE